MGNARLVTLGAVILTVFVGLFVDVSAERFTGGSYTIDASVVGNSFGGDTTGGSYKLTSSGGESLIGQGSGGSYKIGVGYVAQLESSLQLTVQPGSLIGYFALEENSGTFIRDTSFNNNNGTTSGTTWATGKVGTGLSFAGAGIMESTDVDITGTITISAWVNPSSTQSSTIFGKANLQGAIKLFNNEPRFNVTTGGTLRTVDAIVVLTNSTWNHVVGTYDGTNAKIYVNGVERASVAATGAISNNNQPWTAGQNTIGSGGGNSYSGAMDELKVFSRALSANEVKAEYDAGVAGNTAGLSFATSIIPGVSQTSNYDAAVQTDAQNGYNLSVNQNQNLTKGADSITAVSGSIGTPVSWVEGTTKGLGFTLYGTNATSIPGKWSSGGAYAAFPGSSTSYYLRTGRQAAKDVLNMRLRLDVPTSQVAGGYTNVVTTTGTITP
ncbi:MAG: LamG domain-containing protein [Candidatus Saccharimonadales bacterium]